MRGGWQNAHLPRNALLLSVKMGQQKRHFRQGAFEQGLYVNALLWDIRKNLRTSSDIRKPVIYVYVFSYYVLEKLVWYIQNGIHNTMVN